MSFVYLPAAKQNRKHLFSMAFCTLSCLPSAPFPLLSLILSHWTPHSPQIDCFSLSKPILRPLCFCFCSSLCLKYNSPPSNLELLGLSNLTFSWGPPDTPEELMSLSWGSLPLCSFFVSAFISLHYRWSSVSHLPSPLCPQNPVGTQPMVIEEMK